MALLDVPSTTESSLLANIVPENEEQQELRNMFDEALSMSAATAAAKSVQPTKGFCVKFRRVDCQEKAFINICHTAEIPSPEEISEAELTAIIESDDPTKYRVPLSLGSPHDEVDKSGRACTAYDVIINTDLFVKLENSQLFRTFVILLAAQGVEDKYSVALCRDDYVVLQNRRYMGKMPVHYIQDRGSVKPAPLIDVVEQSSTHDEVPSSRNLNKNLKMTLVQKPGRCVEHLVVEAKLANITSPNELYLDLGKDRIVVGRVADNLNEIDVHLPVAINVDCARAQFDHKSLLLRIDIPIMSDQN